MQDNVLEEIRFVVAGGREFNDYDLMVRKLDMWLEPFRTTHKIIIVSGTARGADTLGERYANERGYTVERFVPDWDKWGKVAGLIRNGDMAEVADVVICFWDGKSKGTLNMIHNAKHRGLPLRVVRY